MENVIKKVKQESIQEELLLLQLAIRGAIAFIEQYEEQENRISYGLYLAMERFEARLHAALSLPERSHYENPDLSVN